MITPPCRRLGANTTTHDTSHTRTLTATVSPASQPVSAAPFSDSMALCTWPMLPHAMGTSSIHVNSSEVGRAKERCSARQVYLQGGTAHDAQRACQKACHSLALQTCLQAVQDTARLAPLLLLVHTDRPHLKLCAGACVCSLSSAEHTSCANRSWRVAAHCRQAPRSSSSGGG